MKASQWIPKVLCLIGAIILWIFVMNEQNPFSERTFTVPVHIENFDEDNKVILNPINEIQISVRGPRLSLAEVTVEEIKAYANLKDVSKGTFRFPLKIVLPSGVELVESANYFSEIVIDDLIMKRIPLETQIQGKLSDDFQLGEINLTPKMINVKIPFSEKERVVKGYVPIKLDNATESFVIETTPILGEQLKLPPNWTLSLDKVMVSVVVAPKDSKMVPISFRSVGKIPENLVMENVSIEPSQVRINGSRTALSKVTFLEVEPFDLSNLTQEETKEVMANLKIPTDVVSEVQQVKVVMKIKKR